MTKQITHKELLELVSVEQNAYGEWCIVDVTGTVHGDVRTVLGNVDGIVYGDVRGDVKGDIGGSVDGGVRGSVGGFVAGDVGGSVLGNVGGNVFGTISGREWQYAETPVDKLKRLINEDADKELLLEAVSQMEDN